MEKLIKKGRKVSVSGRFIPEIRMEKLVKEGENHYFNYPPVTLKGVITTVSENKCVVEFDSFKMEINNEELGFDKDDINRCK